MGAANANPFAFFFPLRALCVKPMALLSPGWCNGAITENRQPLPCSAELLLLNVDTA